MIVEPRIISGNVAVDGRGLLQFVNDFTFVNVKRFYVVNNFQKRFVRAWHGHLKEMKYVYTVQGSIMVKVVSFENVKRSQLTKFSPKIYSFILSDRKPQILVVPPGYYNGFKTLTGDASVIFFSTSTLEDSRHDDFREPWNLFGEKIWEVEQR